MPRRSNAAGLLPRAAGSLGYPGRTMATYTRKQFLNLGAVLAGGAGAARLPVAAAQEPAGRGAPGGSGGDQRAGLHRRRRAAPRGGVRGPRRPVHRRGQHRRRPEPRRSGHRGDRRRGDDRHAGVHRHPLAPQRRERALRREHEPADGRRDPGRPAAQGSRHAARPVGAGLHVRRHEGGRRPAAPDPPRRSGAGSPGQRGAPRRAHQLVQQHGVRAGRHHPRHPGSTRRPLRARSRRRALGHGGRARPRRLRRRRRARGAHRGGATHAGAAKGWPTSRN